VCAVRPERVILLCGTGTEVGKTWVGAHLLAELAGRGITVAARKPAQSYDIDLHGVPLGGPTDAEALAAATGEDPNDVCHPFRSYHRAMAPPMAADALGMPPFTVAALVEELAWPTTQVAVGLVETAGGVRSPQADDGDAVDLARILEPDLVVLVADPGLGTVNSVRLSIDALADLETSAGTPLPVVVTLNRFDEHHEVHRRNRDWLIERCGFEVACLPSGVAECADRLAGVDC